MRWPSLRGSLSFGLFSLAFLGGLWLVFGSRENESGPDRLVFLQVGQGDATLFQSGKRIVLVDTGPRNDQGDSAERIVAPAFYSIGVRTIDLLILTHADADHVGGLPALSRRFKFGRIVMPEAFRGHEDMAYWLSHSGLNWDDITWVHSEEKVQIGRWSVTMRCPPPGSALSDNEGSMITLIESPDCRALLPGDAGEPAEAFYLGRYGSKPLDVLKAGHHGSRFSTGADWLKSWKARDVVVSCGRNNTYGHPHPSVMKRIQEVGATVRRTDLEGHLEYRPTPEGFQLFRSIRGREKL